MIYLEDIQILEEIYFRFEYVKYKIEIKPLSISIIKIFIYYNSSKTRLIKCF